MNKIKVMISSTVKELDGERRCIADLFAKNDFVELVGAYPYSNTSTSLSSMINTTKIAQDCDLYILILGHEFGFELEDGRSATEIEFDNAYHADPTKILVFLKDNEDTKAEENQEKFINRVCNYYSGYWRTSFKYTHELQSLVESSFMNWLKERASFNKDFTYLDHFIRLAIQRKPEPTSIVYYCVKKNYIDLEYHFFDKVISVQFDKKQIYKDFWKCLYSLDKQLSSCLEDYNETNRR